MLYDKVCNLIPICTATDINTELDSMQHVSEDTKINLIPIIASSSTPIVVQDNGSQSVADEEVSYFEVNLNKFVKILYIYNDPFTPIIKILGSNGRGGKYHTHCHPYVHTQKTG